MKYKVGDKVRIKSIDWYNKNKSSKSDVVVLGECRPSFTRLMSRYCGKVMTFVGINSKYGIYTMEEDGGMFSWTDEMIEGLVEEETTDYYNFTNDDITNLLKKLNKREAEFVKDMMIELENHKGSAYCQLGVDMDFNYWYDTGR